MSDDRDWKARALAAERTVDVLKRKVVDLYNGGGSNIQHTLERARVREAESRRRRELVELRNAELVRYSARLEAEVAARTRDLQVILDNVVFGFLVVGPDAKIRGFTRSCVELLGTDQLAGSPLAPALGYTATQATTLELALEQVFDDLLPAELTLDQLPHAAIGSSGRSLRLDGRVIRSTEGGVDAILLTISDVTALEAAQRENAHYRLIVQLLRQRDSFVTFVADFLSLAAAAREAIAASDQHLARRAVHTMKGNAGCFGLTDLATLIHGLEDSPNLDPQVIDRIEGELAAFLTANFDVLGISPNDHPGRIAISSRELESLAAATSLAGVAGWIHDIRRRPVRALLTPFEDMVRRLGERCDKRVELVVEGGELRVDGETLAPIMRELGHVVRNAIDHGIETSEDRGDKPIPAQLCIRVSEVGADYEIVVEDDGRGVDVAMLAKKAIAMGVPEADLSTRTYDQLVDLVFVDGLTTSGTVTDVSGRGVGMSAIAAAVRRGGGSIRVHSRPGRGTRIEIRVPRTPPGFRARRPSQTGLAYSG